MHDANSYGEKGPPIMGLGGDHTADNTADHTGDIIMLPSLLMRRQSSLQLLTVMTI